MAEAVLMPQSGISVESCIIGTWKKSVGDTVSVGDVLFDYETDKASFECESTADGVILEIFYHDGDEVNVLKPVCAIGSKGDDISAIRVEAGVGQVAVDDAPSVAGASTQYISAITDESSLSIGPAEPGSEGVVKADPADISPRAKHAAERLGLYTGAAIPSGPNGRTIERDIIALAASGSVASDVSIPSTLVSEPVPVAAVSNDVVAAGTVNIDLPLQAAGPYSDKQFPKIRMLIAEAMHSSLKGSAQLTHHHSFDATEVQAVRKAFKDNAGPVTSGVSIGDMILFTVSRVLTEYPYMNAHLVGASTLRRFERVNLGVAVDTPRGLMVPTIFGADEKSLIEISAEVKELAEAARNGNIDPDLLKGGTFTVSNLGPTGVEMFTPILNPPQIGILGVCGLTTKVRVTESGMEAYPSIGMSLTYDHRAVDGVPASRFAQAVCDRLAQFSILLDI
ncbi:MAG: 2-oxo acid dehydrogenase subunit E2 [Clostridiales Family XIII bacterium]|jgi:pyruvate dehydrogenase E2 component (dihydrolipoamide acetyltransferase)|nr:2-oxo acid dehydrogenase subunit E2 [Clostridiales Family XIII bacterium]